MPPKEPKQVNHRQRIPTDPVQLYRGDRNLALYLPGLAVLVSIEADRPGAWFPGPLSQYEAWFPGIDLNRDFERVKVPGNPMKIPFCFWCLLGVKFLR
jgi:hypothetical protein